MKITIEHGVEIIGNKGYLFTHTLITGLQQAQRHGKTVWVTAVTYHDSREGCTPGYRWYNGPIPPEGEVSNRLPPSVEARLKKLAGQVMIKGETA